MYRIEFTEKAKGDVKKLALTPKYFSKLQKLIEELEKHPKTGTGKPEQLKYYKEQT
jgi:toxin YoeB